MKRLILKLALMCALVAATYGGIALIPPNENVVYASILDKHAILEHTRPPRVIFVGGSNLALGLDSAIVARETKREVVNMGLNGGLGLRYMMNEVKGQVGEGDLVVLCPEYEHFYGDLLDGEINLLWVLQVMPEAFEYLEWDQLPVVALYVPEFMQVRLAEILSKGYDDVYNREGFNRYGDFVNHLGLERPKPIVYHELEPKYANPRTIGFIEEFVRYCEDAGADAVYFYPALSEKQYRLGGNRAQLARIDGELRQIDSLEVLVLPDQCLYPEEEFFDTMYHLKRKGREQRSRFVSGVLSGYLDAE